MCVQRAPWNRIKAGLREESSPYPETIRGFRKGDSVQKIRVFTPPVTSWSEIIFRFLGVCSRLIPSRSCRTMILALLPLWFSFDMRVYASEKIKKDGLFIFLRLISDSG